MRVIKFPFYLAFGCGCMMVGALYGIYEIFKKPSNEK